MRSGQRVGKYILGEQIGRGGMAEVWSARVEGPGGFVKSLALKFISDSFAGDADLERLFVNEARVAAQLQHANLVAVFDFDKWSDPASGEADRYYIAMERVDGQDLRRVLQVARHKGQRLSAALALHIAGEVLKALRYVHERRDGFGGGPAGSPSWGLVHRDVSPHNVLVGMGGEVKLSDFGIAKAMSQSLGTQAGMVRGKLAYASPEQLRGEPVDHRADQFALGVTLWEMLAERRLFEGTNEAEIVGKVLRCEIPALPATVDPAVDRVTRRMLASVPADRFPSTAQALAAVMATPGYAPHAPALVELMHALVAPRPLVLPPTVPLKLTDGAGGPPPGALAETSELESTPLDRPAPAALPVRPDGQRKAGVALQADIQTQPAMGEHQSGVPALEPAQVFEVAAATGSGYVSADTPHLPSWFDQSGAEEPPPRRVMRPVVIAASILLPVLTAVMVTRRGSSPSSRRAPTISDGPRPSAQQPVRLVEPARSPAVVRSAVAPPALSAGPQPMPGSEPSAAALRAPRLPPAGKPPAPLAPEPASDREPVPHEAAESRPGRRRTAARQPGEEAEPRPSAVQPAQGTPSAKKGSAANGAPILE